ncbi:MAG: hypothetical protein EAZ57_03020 [Cytophagales bacterium]|nr:MAG: hypothetical protein EAZ67_03485 [Cytophagales bacterium]TAF61730.1 MAG: hypothetical protein EAZ57_03020 [Cytophagales bacterium]
MRIVTLCLLFCVFFVGLATAQNKTNKKMPKIYLELAKAKFPEGGHESLASPKGQYIVCQKIHGGTVERPETTVHYFVYDGKSKKKIYESTIANGSLKWISDTEIEIQNIPGNPRAFTTGDDYAYIYNAKTQKLTKKVPLKD